MVDKKKEEQSEAGSPKPEVVDDKEQVKEPVNKMEEVNPEETEETTEEVPENPLLAVVGEYFPDVTTENLNEKAVQLIQKLSSIQNTLGDVADEYPQFGMLLNDVFKRMPPEEAIARHYGNELTPPEGDPNWENINKRVSEFNSMKAEKQAKMDQLNKNRDVSVENVQKFIKETELPEEEAIKFLEWYDKLHTDMFDGLVSPEHLAALYKGYVHDTKMAEKDEEISELTQNKEIADKNKTIEEKNTTGEEDDGIPKLNTGGGKTPVKKEKPFGVKFLDGVI